MKLSERVKAFMEQERTECNLLDVSCVSAQALAATRFYAGYGHVNVTAYAQTKNEAPPAPSQPIIGWGIPVQPVARLVDPDDQAGPLPPVAPDGLGNDTQLSESDWAIIRPLFLLYVEREQALMLESSRVMGVDVFGRSSAEVITDIKVCEDEIGRKAFIQPAFSI